MPNKYDKADYSNGKIYKIICNKTELVYIGSTCATLEQRLKRHAYYCKSYMEKKSNSFITSIYVIYYNDYKIELIENYPCNSKKELEDREYYYISQFKCVNSIRSSKYNINQSQCVNNTKPDYIIDFQNIMDKYLKEDLIRILFRYGLDEYKQNKLS